MLMDETAAVALRAGHADARVFVAGRTERMAYPFFAVLVARYACTYRAHGDVEAVIQCAHAALTGLGLLDNNTSGSLLEDERRRQRQSILAVQEVSGADLDLEHRRTGDQTIGLDRFSTVQAHIESTRRM
jgi:hypothetical protein